MYFIDFHIKTRTGDIILIIETLQLFTDLFLMLYAKGFIPLTK